MNRNMSGKSRNPDDAKGFGMGPSSGLGNGLNGARRRCGKGPGVTQGNLLSRNNKHDGG